MNVLKVKFGCQKYSFIGISLKNRLELHAARSSSGRSLTDLHTELRPFLDRTYFEGVEEEEELEKNPESDAVCIDLFCHHYTTTTTTITTTHDLLSFLYTSKTIQKKNTHTY
jgi:hypothetical protein